MTVFSGVHAESVEVAFAVLLGDRNALALDPRQSLVTFLQPLEVLGDGLDKHDCGSRAALELLAQEGAQRIVARGVLTLGDRSPRGRRAQAAVEGANTRGKRSRSSVQRSGAAASTWAGAESSSRCRQPRTWGTCAA